MKVKRREKRSGAFEPDQRWLGFLLTGLPMGWLIKTVLKVVGVLLIACDS
jgi:hypothetical protein